ncbi:class I SAM-dependent methyltransferase [Verrucomicrobiota bacterium sgz303538]
MSREIARGRFEGVWNIVRFNWPMYASSFGVCAASFAWAVWMPNPQWLALAVAAGGSASLLLSLSSLAVAHWIYDRSELYRWGWLPGVLGMAPQRITNIHAGFDEASDALRDLFPKAELTVLDFYDPARNTEPSIERARRWAPATVPAIRVSVDDLPVTSGTQDLVLMFLSAHEVRSAPQRVALFREAARILGNEGRVLVVEHMRDWPNFLAFGPGFLHFHSDRAWRQALSDAGLYIERRLRVTPFIHVLCCRCC